MGNGSNSMINGMYGKIDDFNCCGRGNHVKCSDSGIDGRGYDINCSDDGVNDKTMVSIVMVLMVVVGVLTLGE